MLEDYWQRMYDTYMKDLDNPGKLPPIYFKIAMQHLNKIEMNVELNKELNLNVNYKSPFNQDRKTLPI
jgi:hypothetical protein